MIPYYEREGVALYTGHVLDVLVLPSQHRLHCSLKCFDAPTFR